MASEAGVWSSRPSLETTLKGRGAAAEAKFLVWVSLSPVELGLGWKEMGERKAAELSNGLSCALSLGSWGLVQTALGAGVKPLSPEFLEEQFVLPGRGWG